MKNEDPLNNYYLNDGETLLFKFDFSRQTCTVRLKVREYVESRKLKECVIDLNFSEVLSIDISEDFRTYGRYSDVIFSITEGGSIYLSLDPYGNTGIPDEKDNFVITAKSLVVTSEFKYKQLIDNYINRESSADEFIEGFSHQWRNDRDQNIQYDRRFQSITDRIFTSCDCYSENPEGPDEISEQELKNEIRLLSHIWWG